MSVQNLGSIAASIWALEAKRMKIICRPDELWTVSLLKHKKSIHEGVKYPCDQCDYKATEKGQLLKHMKCVDKSQCVDCIIKHMLWRHVVARALFDGWPSARLHLLL